MSINRKVFFDIVRAKPFAGILTVPQVQGIGVIIDEWERRALTDLRWLAYMLATTFHETDCAMQPIAEYGRGKGHKYGAPDPETGKTYYGRGLVQLTWAANYQKFGEMLKVDLLRNPELALSPPIAAQIMFEGMIRGVFTGKRLADYFNANMTDYTNARRIINGTDRAELIKGYALAFYAALNAAQAMIAPPPPPDIELPPINLPPPGAPARSDLAPTFWGRVKDLFKGPSNV